MAGPNPNFASIWAQLGATLEVPDTALGWASTVQSAEDAVITGRDGLYTPDATILVSRMKANVAGLMGRGTLQGLFFPHLREFSRLNTEADATDASFLRHLFLLKEYMDANSLSINSRGMTFGSISAGGGNTGDGEVVRVTVDPEGNTLEGTTPEAKSANCTHDENNGAEKHAELFRFEGGTINTDGLEFTGSGIMGSRVKAITAADGPVFNPSFEQNSATADDEAPSSTTAISGWTITSSTANYKLRTNAAYVYRGYPQAPSTLWGLEIEGNDTIAQVVKDQRPQYSFGRRVPFLCQIKVKRLASCDGTVTLHLGSSSKALDLTTISNDTWTTLRIDLDEACYGETFNKADLDVKIVTSGITTGTVAVDDLLCAPLTLLNGHWYGVVGGATPFLHDDTFTWTDTDGGTRAVYSYWLWRAVGAWPGSAGIDFWLPTNNAGSETVSDPSY